MICYCDDCEMGRFGAYLDRRREPRSGDFWTSADIELLRQLRDQNLPLREVCKRLGRSVTGVQYATKRYLEEGQQPREEI